MKIDLHSHTKFSDGHLTPEELILRAHTMQVDALAVTDHDTVAGLEEAHATQSKQKRALTIIDGVEISTTWHSFDIHVVGLNVDRHCPTFLERLQGQSQTREARAEKIADKLEKCGFEGVLTRAKALAGVGQVTRAHFARVLVNNYGVPSMDAAFKKYLGKGKRAAVKAEWPSIETAIEWIHDAGGQAVLAHPAHYDMTAKWLRRLVALFEQAGGDAIETAFPGINKTKQELINELAQTHHLLASAGSDFHFPSRWTELGKNLGISSKLTPVWHNWKQFEGQVAES
ncbi:S-adenosylmethionine tRNA ribosyltransferase [Alteromonas macleodii]|uniref:S-adenosylmethionine tRNA ribosyltransferase n=1 Tax=Alteromonas macleodii TaxID=28108 RepID=A0A126Q0L3_ALTMA|nr:PHP domain-containing protein [Alteromonas macleodii]AMJ97979.1 S-adenosylmethionine tRNA ribosyltransferase [Alteromonas macleodii]